MESFQKNIAYLYEVRQIPYSELGRMAGVAHTTVRDWHRSSSVKPLAVNVQKLAHALGYTTDELLSVDLSEDAGVDGSEAYIQATVKRLGTREAIRRLLQDQSRTEPAMSDAPLPVARVVTFDDSLTPNASNRPKADDKRPHGKDSPARKR